MAIRLPLTNIQTVTDTATSGVSNSNAFNLPQDIDCVVVKLTASTFTGTNPTCDVYVQTSDDAGTTWFDVANLGQVTAAIVAQNAIWATLPVGTGGPRAFGSSFFGGIGAAAASTTAARSYSGLPVLSRVMRLSFKYGGTQLANSGITAQILTGSQSSQA